MLGRMESFYVCLCFFFFLWVTAIKEGSARVCLAARKAVDIIQRRMMIPY
jgi:hypothetical protein